ncbi:MAG TPA: glycosyltransferase family 39 protein, partial [Anaerolineae bacterium]
MNKQVTQSKHRLRTAEALLTGLGLFLLALLPRAYALQHFVTADEAKWVYRSAQFLAALLRGDFAGTTVNLTPAVTTTWLGSIGLAIYYQLHRAAIDLPLADWLTSLPEFRTELELLAATRWPMVMLTSLSVVLSYYLMRQLLNPTMALIAAAFIALDPHFVALSRVLGHDAPTTVFMTLSILCLLLAIKPTGPSDHNG